MVDNIQEEFGRLMGETARLWRMALNERLKSSNLSYAKFSALLLLSRHEKGVVQNELANMLSIEKPTLARLLNDLEKDHWIKRYLHPEDKRSKIVNFSEEGKEKYQSIKMILSSLRSQILTGVNDKMLGSTVEVLRIIFDNLGRVSENK